MNYTLRDQQAKIRRIPLLCGSLFLIIVARLFYLQVQTSVTLFTLSKRNCLRFEKIMPPRGNIFDCTGKLIATNRPLIKLVWKGSGKSALDQEQEHALQLLSQLLPSHTIEHEQVLSAERYGTTATLIDEISFEELSSLVEQLPEHTNLLVQTDFKRHYPYNDAACHILGYLSGAYADTQGKMGLEKILNDNLRGKPGQLQATINSIGCRLYEEEIQAALNGQDVHTTLDIELQRIAASCFPANYKGALLLMDAKTGALRVMLSNPTFDPHLFLDPLSPSAWQELQQNRPFLNRACMGSYPPASLFKLVTLIAAFEQHIIHEHMEWNCTGSIEFCGRHYHCKNRTGHGPLSTQEALAQSCNIPFYEIGKRIKIDTLAHYAHMLGLGERTTTLLPEKQGLVPTTYWKRSVYHKPWWPGETVIATIGQGPIEVTPIQICRMFGAIGEGVLVTPRILESEPIVERSVPISKKTLNFMRQALELTIAQGTGQRLKSLKHFKIFGKTGTAQVRALAADEVGQLNDEHGILALWFQYKNYDPAVLVIIVEHAGSSIFATETARNFLGEYAKYMDGITSDELPPQP